ncbi:MAG: DsbA family protein [Candidatus Saccharibacteria bacterium]|nr:DsbA family protein [Candidatus Saccharibacteria bacterium]
MDKEGRDFDVELLTPEEQREQKRRLITIMLILGSMVLVILLLIVGMLSYSAGYSNGNKAKEGSTTQDSTNQSSNSESTEVPDSALVYQSQNVVGEGQIPDHFRGKEDADADHTVIEYADYSCTHCISLAQSIGDVYDKYGDDIRFIYRHFAVGFTYSDVSNKIAEAAYVVGGEEAYWQMSDKLFNDEDLSGGTYMDTDALNDKIIALANDIGVDGQAVLDTYNDSANNGIDAKIERDRQFGSDSGVNGTPTVFLGKQSITGTADDISSALDELLGK